MKSTFVYCFLFALAAQASKAAAGTTENSFLLDTVTTYVDSLLIQVKPTVDQLVKPLSGTEVFDSVTKVIAGLQEDVITTVNDLVSGLTGTELTSVKANEFNINIETLIGGFAVSVQDLVNKAYGKNQSDVGNLLDTFISTVDSLIENATNC